ncbi:MAG TPA: EVE domain-containing protein [Promineifilum sp.]|nr:EVE domain-containing protein [Promineifilum sp.]HRO91627.1 EVE domain-containing protein [Promineifilum sp.]HRQ13423.1 EVE domain-containing protein [Promineifilum sp.]
MKFWINTVSYSHVKRGIEDGITQANHGRVTNLNRVSKGDYITFYSPRTDYNGGEPLQHFTAIARVIDEKPYQVEMAPTFHPWRRRVEYLPCRHVPVQPLIDSLEFVKDKRHWGFPFRRGLFEIGEQDFMRIAHAMDAAIETGREPHPDEFGEE